MYYKINEETKDVAVRVEADLDISIENFLCIVSEVDLFQEFVPFAYYTKKLKEISRNQKIGLTRVYDRCSVIERRTSMQLLMIASKPINPSSSTQRPSAQIFSFKRRSASK